MITVEKMLNVARSYLGYTEKNNTSDLINGEAGNQNMTIFWKRLLDVDFFDGMDKQGKDWCAGFICACSLEATGSKSEGRRLLCQDGSYGAGCVPARDYYIANGRLFTTPKVGDQAFFGQKIHDPDHTGIVEEVYSDGSFVTIEGNWGNKVQRVRHSLTGDLYWKTMDFGRPRYLDAETTEDVQTDISSPEVTEPVVSDSVASYTVVENDTLSEICERFHLDMDTIIRVNNIPDPDMIHVGQKLIFTESSVVEDPEDRSELKIGDRVRMAFDAPVYGTQIKFFTWVYNTTLYVRQISDERVIISTNPDGDITGAVDAKYLTKV